MKLTRPITIPLILLIYLGVMAYLGLEGLKTGQTSLLTYTLTIIVTLGIIIALHFFLKKREKLRKERLDDLKTRIK